MPAEVTDADVDVDLLERPAARRRLRRVEAAATGTDAADRKRGRACSPCSRSPTPTSSKCTSSSTAGAPSAARRRARGLVGAVEATIDAVRELGAPIDAARPVGTRRSTSDGDERVLVAVALDADDDDEPTLDYGIAAGASPIDAAARATLDALNRRLARVL